jgi:erythronate-4-phosphate dehydrogenase
LHVVKILADQNIPCVADAFRDLGEVQLMPGRDIRREHLRDCRCLVTRTVTRVDRELLDGTPVEFVGTATIGTDHIDLDYLRSAGIGCSNAAGCNAEAASEYVVSGLFALSKRNGFDPFRLRAGIVGHGNVGSRLRQKLDALGIDCLLCDPPLQEAGDSSQDFVDLDTILQECSFISLHVPLTRDGSHPTYHLLDRDRLPNLAAGCLLVNAARGEVVDNAALLELLHQRDDLSVFLDTWEGERTAAARRSRDSAYRRLQRGGPATRDANGTRRGLRAFRAGIRLAHVDTAAGKAEDRMRPLLSRA